MADEFALLHAVGINPSDYDEAEIWLLEKNICEDRWLQERDTQDNGLEIFEELTQAELAALRERVNARTASMCASFKKTLAKMNAGK